MKTNENKIKQNKNKMDVVKMLSRQNNRKYKTYEICGIPENEKSENE